MSVYRQWKRLQQKWLDAAKQEVEHLSRKAISDVRALNPKDDYLEILLESLIYREK